MAMIKRGASLSPVSSAPTWNRIKNMDVSVQKKSATNKKVTVEDEDENNEEN